MILLACWTHCGTVYLYRPRPHWISWSSATKPPPMKEEDRVRFFPAQKRYLDFLSIANAIDKIA